MGQPTGNAKGSLKSWLNSPELNELRAAWADEELRTKASDQAWWDSLLMEERAQAFRQVVSLMYKAEVKERGSYRHAMYDVFNVDYLDGMMCNYMELHNLIHKGLSSQENGACQNADDQA